MQFSPPRSVRSKALSGDEEPSRQRDDTFGHSSEGRRMNRITRYLTCVFAVLTCSASPAFSCTCGPKPSVGRALSLSDAVFVGRVIAWHNATIEFAPGQSFSGFSFVFEVERLFKGAVSSEVAVLTGIGRGDCGYPFQVGEKYLVYAYEKKGLETNICTRTTNISRGDADLAELGDPKTTFVHVINTAWSKAIAIILLAFLAGIVIGRKWLSTQGSGNSVDDLAV